MNALPATASELVPLAERTGVLHAFRLAMVAGVLVVAALVPDTIGASVASLAPLTAVYAVVTVGAEGARRAARRRGLALVGALLLADAAWIAAVVALTGGPRSLLSYLVVLHLVAVTLLASYRTGLKIAVWHSLLFLVGTGLSGRADGVDSAVVATVSAFMIMALGTAAFSAVNERELRRSRGELLGLTSMGSELEQVRTPDAVARVVLRRVLETFGLRRAALVVGDEAGTREMWVANDGGRLVTHDERKAPADEVLRRCWHRRLPELVRALDDDAPVLAAALPNASNVVVLPLVADGRAIGALAVERGGGLAALISATRVRALVQFAAHGALSLRNAWLLTEVERLARVDGLSGLANRRTFEETLEQEVARAQRSGEPLSLVLLDIDHFKRLNDTYGHQVGDDVLRLVGQALEANVRQVDLAARYGGEEFGLVLPNCPLDAALKVAEQTRETIGGRAGELPVTASAGVATLGVHATTAAELVNAADEALYRAKREGRDRVRQSGRRLRPLASAEVVA